MECQLAFVQLPFALRAMNSFASLSLQMSTPNHNCFCARTHHACETSDASQRKSWAYSGSRSRFVGNRVPSSKMW